MRAYQVYQGDFFPTKERNIDGGWTVGGMVDKNITPLDGVYHYLKFFSENKVTPKAQQRASSLDWYGDIFIDIRNVAIYPPFLYMPSALGIALGKALAFNIEKTLLLCRIIQALCVFGLAFTGLWVATKGQWWLCIVLLLPMSLGQMASVSQDGFLISIAALSVALLSRIPQIKSPRRASFWFGVVALCFWLLATARPPYLALVLSIIVVAHGHKNSRPILRTALWTFVFVCVATFFWFWHLSMDVFLKDHRIEGVSYVANLDFLLFQPVEWFVFLWKSIIGQWSYYLKTFVGNLGHHDTQFPDWYYVAAPIALCIAGVLTSVSQKGQQRYAWFYLTIVLLTMLGIFMALFVTWTPLNYPMLHGVQGRYFIPVVFFLGLIDLGNQFTLPHFFRLWAVRLLLGFALVTLMLTPYVVYFRYYG